MSSRFAWYVAPVIVMLIAFRDRMAKEKGFELLVHTNPDGIAQGINPFDHGSNTHTHIMKTVALRQALDAGGYGSHLRYLFCLGLLASGLRTPERSGQAQ